ncbi:hypothetical protein DFR86_11390 [Acidianus sulfidivorans JP7]|uniref:Uncharacterized protein n=1 Tax=Acidianus sulfidivorans JP7 TaxID=619593 RepID=A0A2U9IPU8_9CREN|nr:hypothetical protein [Acidianus sulfidivorans]AWR98078.1 hypothetical protein DFR86_11390 [Acidianus sulfidivorans JP7]
MLLKEKEEEINKLKKTIEEQEKKITEFTQEIEAIKEDFKAIITEMKVKPILLSSNVPLKSTLKKLASITPVIFTLNTYYELHSK